MNFPKPVLSKPQASVMMCRANLLLVMAGQRAGKSFGIGYRTGFYIRQFPQMIGMIAANTYKQLTQSTLKECRKVWKVYYGFEEYDLNRTPFGCYVVNKKPPRHFSVIHEFDDYDGVISFRNGACVFIGSLENYKAHDGKTLGWCELDETKDTKEEAVKLVILARLSQDGMYYDDKTKVIRYIQNPSDAGPEMIPYTPCVINTSPAEGIVDWIVEMFDLVSEMDVITNCIFNPNDYYFRRFGTKAVCIYSTYWNHHTLPKNYISNRLEQLTKGQAQKYIYGYPFSKTGDEYFDYFDRMEHVGKVERVEGWPDHLGYDFNLVPYMTLVCMQFVETETQLQVRIYKEFCLKPPYNTTEDVSQAWMREYGNNVRDLYYYGDAQGTRGVEGYGDKFTRFDPVRTVLFRLVTRSSDRTTRRNIGVNKRRVLLNKIMAGKHKWGKKDVVFMVDESCVETIKDLQYLKLGMNGKVKEKEKDKETGREYEKLGHCSDAFEYVCAEALSVLIE